MTTIPRMKTFTFESKSTLDADDVKALRRANQISFHATRFDVAISAVINERSFTEVEQRVFNKTEWSARTERSREIMFSDGGGAIGFEAFAMVYNSPAFKTFARSLRSGDRLTMVFRADAETTQSLAEAGFHGDDLHIEVDHADGRPQSTFFIESTIRQDGFARMVRVRS